MLYSRSLGRRAKRPGKVLVLVALCLIPLIGAAAIALEGGLLFDHKRQVQAAADAAALAAAESLFINYQTYQGADYGDKAYNAAINSAAKNGFSNDGVTSTVTVNIPPKTGIHANTKGYAEVIIQFNQPRYLSNVFGSTPMPVEARAVARGMWAASKMGVLVLDLHASESLKANGGGTVQVANADLIVNSDSSSAVGSDGTGTIIKVTNASTDLTGGLKSNTTVQGTVVYNQPPTSDPLAYLPAPTKPSTALSASTTSASSLAARVYLTALGLLAKDVGKLYILEPGRYDSMPNFTNGDVVILKQKSYNNQNGVYYLNGCGFNSTGATIVVDPTGSTSGGVMFYNDPQKTSDGISITGGTVTLSPPTSGPYKGILIWERRDATIPLQITGQGAMNIYGTFYVAGGPIQITGSSATHLDVIGSQYISDTVQAGGNGSFMVDWEPDKVAPMRQLAIVE